MTTLTFAPVLLEKPRRRRDLASAVQVIFAHPSSASASATYMLCMIDISPIAPKPLSPAYRKPKPSA